MNKVYFILPKQSEGRIVSLSSVAPPAGPTYLYAYAKSMNFGDYSFGACYDLTIHKETFALKKIKKGDLVCLSTLLSNYKNVLSFALKAKRKGAKIAIGGPWASVKANQIFNKNPFIDYIAIGEGEAALKQILFNKAKKGIINIKNPPFNKLPTINFSGWLKKDLLQYQENYKKMLKSGAYGTIPQSIPFFIFYQSSRGCIQNPRCAFCGSRLGESYVTRTASQFYSDVQSIVKQITLINKKVHIFDCSDSFTSGIDRLKKYKSFPNVTFTVYGRIDELTAKRIEMLKKLRVTKISIGFETGSSKSIKEIGKAIQVKDSVKVVKLLKEAGISVYVNLIYGVKNETRKDIEKTVDLFAQLAEVGNIYRVGTRIISILPNSRWYFELLNKIKEKDLELSNKIYKDDNIDLELIQDLWLKNMTKLTLKDIEKAHKRLIKIAKKNNITFSSELPRGIL